MKWDNEDDKRGSHSEWNPIDMYRRLWGEQLGVYIFADKDHDVKYISYTGVDGMRDAIDDAKSLGKDRDAALVKALYTESFDDAESLAAELIAKYDPPNNRT